MALVGQSLKRGIFQTLAQKIWATPKFGVAHVCVRRFRSCVYIRLRNDACSMISCGPRAAMDTKNLDPNYQRFDKPMQTGIDLDPIHARGQIGKRQVFFPNSTRFFRKFVEDFAPGRI